MRSYTNRSAVKCRSIATMTLFGKLFMTIRFQSNSQAGTRRIFWFSAAGFVWMVLFGLSPFVVRTTPEQIFSTYNDILTLIVLIIVYSLKINKVVNFILYVCAWHAAISVMHNNNIFLIGTLPLGG